MGLGAERQHGPQVRPDLLFPRYFQQSAREYFGAGLGEGDGEGDLAEGPQRGHVGVVADAHDGTFQREASRLLLLPATFS